VRRTIRAVQELVDAVRPGRQGDGVTGLEEVLLAVETDRELAAQN